jgi:hypothetical protein
VGTVDRSVPADHEAWREARWEELAGPHGKAKVVAKGIVAPAGKLTSSVASPAGGAPPRQARSR